MKCVVCLYYTLLFLHHNHSLHFIILFTVLQLQCVVAGHVTGRGSFKAGRS